MTGIGRGTLRAWRRSRGWDVPEMARRLRRAAGDDPVPVHDALVRMVRRWEREGLRTERYELLYAAAFGVSPDDLSRAPGTGTDTSAPPGEISAVTAGDVAVIRTMLDSLTASDRQFGGGHAVAHAMDYLRTIVTPRLDADCPGKIRRDLCAVTVEFQLRAASMQLDAGRARESLRLLGQAFPLAQETGEPALAAWVLARFGEQHMHDGNAGQALAYTSGAAAMAGRATPAARSFILIKHAMALSLTGDAAATRRAIGQAWTAHASTGAGEPEWMHPYGVEHLQHDEGRCWNNLGHGNQAVTAADKSLRRRRLARPRAFTLAVKTLGFLSGPVDLDAACETGHELVAVTRQISSGRVGTEIGKVVTALRPYRASRAVSDLIESARPLTAVQRP